jgi:hypothetical protein
MKNEELLHWANNVERCYDEQIARDMYEEATGIRRSNGINVNDCHIVFRHVWSTRT